MASYLILKAGIERKVFINYIDNLFFILGKQDPYKLEKIWMGQALLMFT